MTLKPPLVAGDRSPRQAAEGVSVSAIVIVPVATLPASPEEGQMVRLSTDGLLYKYLGGLWSVDSGGGNTRYVHAQSTPATTWNIAHGLNARPSVTVVDSLGVSVIGEIAWPTLGTVTITFLAPIAGYAYLN